MEKDKIKKYQIIACIFTIILGFLFHFMFELTGKNIILAAFFPVNESIWEHLKLIVFPSIIIMLLGYKYISKYVNNYICLNTISIVVSCIFIIVSYYTYTGVLGKDIAFVDILLFIISIILQSYICYKLSLRKVGCNRKKSILILVIVAFLFVIFTYIPLHINIFKDPLKNKYGII